MLIHTHVPVDRIDTEKQRAPAVGRLGPRLGRERYVVRWDDGDAAGTPRITRRPSGPGAVDRQPEGQEAGGATVPISVVARSRQLRRR